MNVVLPMKGLEMRTPYLSLQVAWSGGGGRPLRPKEEVKGHFRWEVEMSVPEYKNGNETGVGWTF